VEIFFAPPVDNTFLYNRIYLSRSRQSVGSSVRRPRLIEIVIVIVLVLLLLGSFPVYPYSREWGYRGSGVLGTILLIVVILWLLHIV
jgi:hypothetical protein